MIEGFGVVVDAHTSGPFEVTRVENAARPDEVAVTTGGAELSPRESLLDRYTLLRKLGEGGMGIVYSAYDEELDRRVAIKLLRARGGGGPQRMLREAQAMARLSHPNVVQVYDVGVISDQLFVAMEHVQGQSLREYVGLAPDPKDSKLRPWREVVAIFVQAGAGLAAAHAAGIVHRDFKPDNVLVGVDGRARVLDFGLASRTEAATSSEDSGSRTGSRRLRSSAVGLAALTESGRTDSGKFRSSDVEVTAAGTLIGTPAYMSPEQHLRQPADARSDQFSFCVALYEALYGERPFAGKTLGELRAAVFSGRFKELPAGRKVPGWLRRVVLRGLSVSPEDRFPAMGELLAALAADPARARARWLLAIGAFAFAASLVGLALQQRAASAQMCRGADAKLAEVWGPERAAAVEAALRGTGQAYAGDTWSRVQEQIELYVETWRRGYVEACEATRVHGEQSDELLDLRMACLADGLTELRALVDVLAEADAKVAERAVQAVAGLRPPQRCADVAALRAIAAPLPADVPAVRTVRSKLAQVHAEDAAGRWKQGLALAGEAVETAETTRFAPVQVEALLVRGRMEERVADYAAAARTLVDAYARAEAIDHAEAKAAIATMLLKITGERQSREADAALWSRIAAAVLDRRGRQVEARVEYLGVLGLVHTRFGRLDEALATLDEALVLETGRPGVRPRQTLFHRYRGNALYRLARYDEAQREYQRAVQLAEASFGSGHPEVANSVNNLGETLRVQGRLDDAEEKFRRALAIWEQAFGADHPGRAAPLNGLASTAYDRGDHEAAAREYRRVIALFERVLGPDHPDLGIPLTNLGEVELRQHRPAEARATLERALALMRGLGDDHPMVAASRTNLGNALAELGLADEAAAELDAAIAILERAHGRDYPELAPPLLGRGRLALALDRPAEAAPLFERALKLREAAGARPAELAEARLGLAAALWDSNGDRARARSLAEQARATLLIAPAGGEVVALERQALAWLGDHPRP